MLQQDSILITGGGGMLSTAFRSQLPAARFVDKASLDITNETAVRNLFGQSRPKILINCAAYTKVDLAEKEEGSARKINGDATSFLAKCCREFDTTLVHYSTDYVFDGSIRRPLKPDDPVGPQSAYGRSKLLGEQLLQQNAPKKWLIIRTAWLYGPGGPSFPQTIVNAARAGKPLSVVDDQIGSPTLTKDLAAATIDLLEYGQTGIWHIANDGQTNWHDFAAEILSEFGIEAKLSRTTSAEWKKSRPESANRPAYSVLDITPFQQLSGGGMRSWREALIDYVTSTPR